MRAFIYVVIIIIISMMGGCQPNYMEDPSATNSVKHDNVSYEIQQISSVSDDNKIVTLYPQLISAEKDYSIINSLISSEVNGWIRGNIAEDATVKLSYSTTYFDDICVCILFEGDVSSPNSAHPTRVAFSVCVSLVEETIMNPLESIMIDDGFVEQFREQVILSSDSDRFTNEQWNEVVAFFDSLSNEELQQLIVNGETSLVEDGLLVCVSVPHAIGDYIKVSIKAGDGSVS